MSNSVHFSLWSSRESTITQLANLCLVGLFTFSFYSYKLSELDVKSVLTITLIASQVYLLLESLNRLTMRQIGGAFFGALLFAVLPWTHAIVASGVDLAPEMYSLFFLLMVLSHQYSSSLDFLFAGIVMLLMFFASSGNVGYYVVAFSSFLLIVFGLIDRESTAKRKVVSLGLCSIPVFVALSYSWITQAMNTKASLLLFGGFVLISFSFLGYLTVKGYWMQRALLFLALFVLTLSCMGTFFFPFFLMLTVLFVLGLLPRFWMRYPFVGGFVYCCWETWPV